MNEAVAPWPLSEVVGQQIARLRRASGLTREQLAEACRKVGAPESLSAAAIANIETGRPDGSGRRRRELTIDEVAIFGRALGVPPLMLAVPFDRVEKSEVLPGAAVPAWMAFQWMSGRAPFPGETDVDAFGRGAVAVKLWDAHDRHVRDWEKAFDYYKRFAKGNPDAPEDQQKVFRDEAMKHQRTMWNAEEQLKRARQQMREHGIPVPPEPEWMRRVEITVEPDEEDS